MLTIRRSYYLLSLLLIFGPSSSLLACSCGEFPSFCGKAVFFEKLLVEVVGHQAGIYNGYEQEYFTQVRVITDMDNAGYPDTISLVNQNGFNCNGDVYGTLIGDSLIVSLRFAEISQWPEELENVPPYPTYDLFGCGQYFLPVNDGWLGGGNSAEVRLEDFLADPVNNCPVVSSVEEVESLSQVQIGPNPVESELRIVNLSEVEIEFRLYTLQGQPVGATILQSKQAGDVPMSDLPAGVYLLRQKAALAEKSQLIVKMNQ